MSAACIIFRKKTTTRVMHWLYTIIYYYTNAPKTTSAAARILFLNVRATQPIRLLPLAQYNYTFSRLVIQKGLF